MALRIYNTLTRQKEDFAPLHGNRVSMFVCGITPHDLTHVGHAKTYVAFDVVARYLRYKGYSVFYVQNVTDIEDRVIEKIEKLKRDWKDIVAEYWQDYEQAMAALRCDSVNLYAWATDYMPEIIEQIQGLIDRHFAYVADGNVYFDTTKFLDWGKLSGQKVEEHLPGARVAVDERKRNPADFTLWKSKKPGEPAWESPWGSGRPGWHIEDTAITVRLLGEQYDLHGGAAELKFPHHEAEIAQAESFTGVKPLVRYWMHGGMLMVKGEEMHKSLGNFWSVRDALKRVSREELRFYLLNAQYRSPIDFTLEGLDEARAAYRRLVEGARKLREARLGQTHPRKGVIRALQQQTGSSPSPLDGELIGAADVTRQRFEDAMDDDFNTREAISALFDLMRVANRVLSAGVGVHAIRRAEEVVAIAKKVLGLPLRSQTKQVLRTVSESVRVHDSAIGTEFVRVDRISKVESKLIESLVELRELARQREDFETSDRIRARLAELGIVLEDTKEGVRWKVR